MKQVLFRLPAELKQQLKIVAAKRGVYLSQLLGEVIEKFLEDERS